MRELNTRVLEACREWFHFSSENETKNEILWIVGRYTRFNNLVTSCCQICTFTYASYFSSEHHFQKAHHIIQICFSSFLDSLCTLKTGFQISVPYLENKRKRNLRIFEKTPLKLALSIGQYDGLESKNQWKLNLFCFMHNKFVDLDKILWSDLKHYFLPFFLN